MPAMVISRAFWTALKIVGCRMSSVCHPSPGSVPSDISEALFGDSARPFSPSTRPKAGFRGAGGQMLRIRRRSASYW